MNIISATPLDADRIQEIYLDAFGEGESAAVADCALALLRDPSEPPSFHLLAHVDGVAVGHISFSPVHGKDAGDRVGYILCPLAVIPPKQRCGIGTALVREGVRRLQEQGEHLLFVYGDPAYYQRFGFTAELATPFQAPYPLTYPTGWQAMRLDGGSTGSPPVAIQCVPALSHPELW